MNTLLIEITPSMAEDWLAKSAGNPRWTDKNRLYNNATVNKIADDIKAGHWNPSNNSIAFDENGVLADGHHRLKAIAVSGQTVSSLVTFNMPPESLVHIDENHPRTVGQRLGVKPLAAAAANCHFWLMNESLSQSSASAELTAEWLNQHPLVSTAVDISSVGNGNSGGRLCRKASIAHAVLCALEYGVADEKLLAFTRIVNSGFVSSNEESAAIVLRNMLLKTPVRSRSASLFIDKAAQNAIHDFVSKTPRRIAYTKPVPWYFNQLVKRNYPGYVNDNQDKENKK